MRENGDGVSGGWFWGVGELGSISWFVLSILCTSSSLLAVFFGEVGACFRLLVYFDGRR